MCSQGSGETEMNRRTWSYPEGVCKVISDDKCERGVLGEVGWRIQKRRRNKELQAQRLRQNQSKGKGMFSSSF